MTPEDITQLQILAEGIDAKLARLATLAQVVAAEQVKEKHFVQVLATTNGIEWLRPGSKDTFRIMWIYPGKAVAAGVITANLANVLVGKRGDGPDVVTDTLGPTDIPFSIQLPIGQRMKISDIAIYGTAGDGVFVSYW